MKKLIALLCTLCMIATMVPFAAMAEEKSTITVYKSWDGSVVPNTTDHGFMITDKTVLNPQAVTTNLGGNSGPYMQFTAASTAAAADEVLVYSSGSLKYDAPYAAISVNVYGKALQDMYTRYSSKVKPQVTGGISGNLVADRWNNVFVAWDGAAKETTVYVNGTEIRTQNFYDFVEGLGTASDTDTTVTTVDREANTWTWTDGSKSESGTFSSILTDVRMKFVKDSETDLVYNIDDIYVMTADTEITPAAYAEVTADGAFVGDNEIVVTSASSVLGAGDAKILIKHNDVWSEGIEVVAGDEVVVVTSTPYGNIYKNYTVTTMTCDKLWDGSSSDTLKSEIGWSESFLTAEFKADGLGGNTGTYASYTGSENEAVIFGKNNYTTRYFAMSINAYGKSIRDMFPRLASGSYKPSLVANAKFGGNLKGHLIDNKWNNVFFVFDSQTKNMKTYVNGELKASVNLYDIIESELYNGTVDREAGTAVIGTTNINANLMSLKEDVRILLNNGSASYIDDLAFMYTDYEPAPADYVTEVKVNGEAASGLIVLPDGTSSVKVEADGATVMVNDGTGWAQKDTVSAGDEIMLVTQTPYGNIYSTSNIGVVDSANTKVLATMESGMSFVQGGAPWIADENGTIANENGEMGIRIPVTGTGNDVLIADVANVFGSKLGLKEYIVGYNYFTSTQTYYQANWKKAEVETSAKYLVFEADFAFPAQDHVSGFSLSTNGGTRIGSSLEYNDEVAARVNHYMWIYDIAAGTYVDYLNGAALVDEPTAVLTRFATGEATNIRFTANGTTKMKAQKTEQLDENGNVVTDENGNAVMVDWYGTYDGGLKGYMGNLVLSSTAAEPEVKTAPAMAGATGSCYPVYGESTLTVDYIKNTLVNDATVNTYVYTNRAYDNELTDGSAAVDLYYVVVTEKDGICGYYRI